MTDITQLFWQAYLDTLPEQHPHRFLPLPEAWGFGDSPDMADRLGALVLQGKKTATSGRYLGENLLSLAGPSIVLNGAGRPLCVVETWEITVRRFRDMDAQFAADEGEGDRTLAYWRQAHWDFFSREGAREGYPVSPDMLLVCERFTVLFRNPDITTT